MYDQYQSVMRACVALQVALLEYADSDLADTIKKQALQECHQELTERLKLMLKLDGR